MFSEHWKFLSSFGLFTKAMTESLLSGGVNDLLLSSFWCSHHLRGSVELSISDIQPLVFKIRTGATHMTIPSRSWVLVGSAI